MARRFGANGSSKHWMKFGEESLAKAIDKRATPKKAKKKGGKRIYVH